MDKVLVEIIAPATSNQYDFWISKKLLVREARQKILDEIVAYERNEYIEKNHRELCLYKKEKNGLIDDSLTIEQAGIHSGDSLMIV